MLTGVAVVVGDLVVNGGFVEGPIWELSNCIKQYGQWFFFLFPIDDRIQRRLMNNLCLALTYRCLVTKTSLKLT